MGLLTSGMPLALVYDLEEFWGEGGGQFLAEGFLDCADVVK